MNISIPFLSVIFAKSSSPWNIMLIGLVKVVDVFGDFWLVMKAVISQSVSLTLHLLISQTLQFKLTQTLHFNTNYQL